MGWRWKVEGEMKAAGIEDQKVKQQQEGDWCLFLEGKLMQKPPSQRTPRRLDLMVGLSTLKQM